MARRNQVSCLPTGASGAVLEMSRDGGTAVVAPVLPGELVHPAAPPASTTPSPAHTTRRAAFLRASCPLLPRGKPPAEGTRRRPSQNQIISSRPSQWAWCDHCKQQRASAALTGDYAVIASLRAPAASRVMPSRLSLLAASWSMMTVYTPPDVDAVVDGFGTPDARPIRQATPGQLRARSFPDGSMGPKVEAACRFVEATGQMAAIGRLDAAQALLNRTAGTMATP